MHTVNGVEARLHRFFRERLNVEIATPDTDLFDSGALDSLALVQLLMVLEDELGRKLSLEELEPTNFRSIGSIAELVRRDGPAS